MPRDKIIDTPLCVPITVTASEDDLPEITLPRLTNMVSPKSVWSLPVQSDIVTFHRDIIFVAVKNVVKMYRRGQDKPFPDLTTGHENNISYMNIDQEKTHLYTLDKNVLIKWTLDEKPEEKARWNHDKNIHKFQVWDDLILCVTSSKDDRPLTRIELFQLTSNGLNVKSNVNLNVKDAGQVVITAGADWFAYSDVEAQTTDKVSYMCSTRPNTSAKFIENNVKMIDGKGPIELLKDFDFSKLKRKGSEESGLNVVDEFKFIVKAKDKILLGTTTQNDKYHSVEIYQQGEKTANFHYVQSLITRLDTSEMISWHHDDDSDALYLCEKSTEGSYTVNLYTLNNPGVICREIAGDCAVQKQDENCNMYVWSLPKPKKEKVLSHVYNEIVISTSDCHILEQIYIDHIWAVQKADHLFVGSKKDVKVYRVPGLQFLKLINLYVEDRSDVSTTKRNVSFKYNIQTGFFSFQPETVCFDLESWEEIIIPDKQEVASKKTDKKHKKTNKKDESMNMDAANKRNSIYISKLPSVSDMSKTVNDLKRHSGTHGMTSEDAITYLNMAAHYGLAEFIAPIMKGFGDQWFQKKDLRRRELYINGLRDVITMAMECRNWRFIRDLIKSIPSEDGAAVMNLEQHVPTIRLLHNRVIMDDDQFFDELVQARLKTKVLSDTLKINSDHIFSAAFLNPQHRGRIIKKFINKPKDNGIESQIVSPSQITPTLTNQPEQENSTSPDGLMHLAIKFAHLDGVKTLLRVGKNSKMATIKHSANGRTPLAVAYEVGPGIITNHDNGEISINKKEQEMTSNRNSMSFPDFQSGNSDSFKLTYEAPLSHFDHRSDMTSSKDTLECTHILLDHLEWKDLVGFDSQDDDTMTPYDHILLHYKQSERLLHKNKLTGKELRGLKKRVSNEAYAVTLFNKRLRAHRIWVSLRMFMSDAFLPILWLIGLCLVTVSSSVKNNGDTLYMSNNIQSQLVTGWENVRSMSDYPYFLQNTFVPVISSLAHVGSETVNLTDENPTRIIGCARLNHGQQISPSCAVPSQLDSRLTNCIAPRPEIVYTDIDIFADPTLSNITINKMIDENVLNKKTRTASLKFVVWSVGVNSLVSFQYQVAVSPSGRLKKSITVYGQTGLMYFRDTGEIIKGCQIALLICFSLHLIYVGINRIFFKATPRRFLKFEFFFVEVLIVVVFITFAILQGYVNTRIYHYTNLKPSIYEYVDLEKTIFIQYTVLALVSFYILLLGVCVFRSTTILPWAGPMTTAILRTLTAKTFILFGLFFIFVVAIWSVIFNILLGNVTSGYEDYASAFLASWSALVGNSSVDKLRETSQYMGPIVYLSFALSMNIVLLNMFIAVVNDLYSKYSADKDFHWERDLNWNYAQYISQPKMKVRTNVWNWYHNLNMRIGRFVGHYLKKCQKFRPLNYLKNYFYENSYLFTHAKIYDYILSESHGYIDKGDYTNDLEERIEEMRDEIRALKDAIATLREVE